MQEHSTSFQQQSNQDPSIIYTYCKQNYAKAKTMEKQTKNIGLVTNGNENKSAYEIMFQGAKQKHSYNRLTATICRITLFSFQFSGRETARTGPWCTSLIQTQCKAEWKDHSVTGVLASSKTCPLSSCDLATWCLLLSPQFSIETGKITIFLFMIWAHE